MMRFVRRYNRLVSEGQPGTPSVIEVIHGKGKGEAGGLIRDTLRRYLREHGKRITGFDVQLVLRGADYLLDKYPGDLAYIHGEDATRNAGCTFVIPRRRLYPPRDWLVPRFP